MKKIISALIGLAIVFSILGSFPATAADSGKCGENVYWSYDSDTGTLTISGTGEMQDYLGYPDSTPAPWKNLDVTHVVIENGVTSIGGFAFFECNSLETLTMADSVLKIASCAISGCPNLYQIIVSYNLNSIGSFGISYCAALESLALPSAVNSIAYKAFSGLTALTSLTVETDEKSVYKMVNGTALVDTRTGELLFSLTDEIPADGSVKKIGAGVFADRALGSIIIPASVVSIDVDAFNNCGNLKKVYYCGTENSWNTLKAASESAPGHGNDSLFGAENIYFMPNDSYYNPYGNQGQPNPNFVGKCGDTAYWTYDSESGTLTILGAGDMLDYLYSGSQSTPWRYTMIKHVIIRDGITGIGECAFYNCPKLETVSMADTVKEIRSRAFNACPKLYQLNLSNSLEKICSYAFYDCCRLTGITLPLSVKTVEPCAFLKMPHLYMIDLEWGNPYFLGGSYLIDRLNEKLLFSNGWEIPGDGSAKTICPGVFSEMTFDTFVIPAFVEKIERDAFKGCDNLATVYFCGSQAEWQQLKAASDLAGNETLFGAEIVCDYVSNNAGYGIRWTVDAETGTLTVAGKGAICDYSGINMPWYPQRETVKHILIEEGITSIGMSAFSGMKNAESVKIGSGVGLIDSGAFSGCSNLRRVEMPKTIKTICMVAFDSCPKFKCVFYAGSEEEWNKIDFDFANEPLENVTVFFNGAVCPHKSLTEIKEIQPSYTADGYTLCACSLCGVELKTNQTPRIISNIKGDATGDGDVDMKDILCLRRVVAGLEPIRNEAYYNNANVFADGSLNLKDILKLRRAVAGIEALD